MSARGWSRVLGPALMTFAAGGLMGFLLGSRLHRQPAHSILESDLARYHQSLSAEFAFDEQERQDLSKLLFKHQEDRKELWAEHQWRLEDQLQALDRRTEGWIRDYILETAAQREQWDDWARTRSLHELASVDALPADALPADRGEG